MMTKTKYPQKIKNTGGTKKNHESRNTEMLVIRKREIIDNIPTLDYRCQNDLVHVCLLINKTLLVQCNDMCWFLLYTY